MRTEYNCPVIAGKPKVAFRETIAKEAKYVDENPGYIKASWHVPIFRYV